MIRKYPALAILLSIMLLCSGCSKRKAQSASAYAYAEDSYAVAEDSYAPAESAALFDSGSSSGSSSYKKESAKTETSVTPSDSAVRKIIYNADMSATADDPASVRDLLIAKAEEFGGYVSSSNSTASDDEVSSVKLQLKVPANHLEELVEMANGLAKVKSYHLYSDDISQRYYDIQARLCPVGY